MQKCRNPNSTMLALKSWGYKSHEVIPPSPLVLCEPIVQNGKCNFQTSTTVQRQTDNVSTLNSSIFFHAAQGGTEDHNHSYKQRHRRYYGDKRTNFKSSPTSNLFAESDLFKHRTGNINEENCATCNSCSSTYQGDSGQDYAFSEDSENFSEAFSPILSKHKRFCNTYNILNQSGLLGITLRTKELIQQNKRSQAQLQKLHAHTDLFLEALKSRDPQVWTKLQRTFKNSTFEE